MSAVNWPTILTAIQNLFQTGSGLADTRVLFQRNGHRVNRPDGTGAWISLRFKGLTTIGEPYTVEEVDGGAPLAGEEIIQRTLSQSRVVFEATAYPPETETDSTTAFAILSDVMHESRTPARLAALTVAGVGALKFESVLPLDGMIASRFEPRAVGMFAFNVTGETVTKTGYIRFVNIEVDILNAIGAVVREYDFTLDLVP